MGKGFLLDHGRPKGEKCPGGNWVSKNEENLREPRLQALLLVQRTVSMGPMHIWHHCSFLVSGRQVDPQLIPLLSHSLDLAACWQALL